MDWSTDQNQEKSIMQNVRTGTRTEKNPPRTVLRIVLTELFSKRVVTLKAVTQITMDTSVGRTAEETKTSNTSVGGTAEETKPSNAPVGSTTSANSKPTQNEPITTPAKQPVLAATKSTDPTPPKSPVPDSQEVKITTVPPPANQISP